MAKRYILPINEIYKRRGQNWEYHYNKRVMVAQSAHTLDVRHVTEIISLNVPPPELITDASILCGIATLKGVENALTSLHWTYQQHEIICIWYWTEEYWQDFVRAFQSLPDVYEDHYYAYDEELDAMRFYPLSQKGKSGGSRGEVGQFPQNGRKKRQSAPARTEFP
jgi:hypothetical protein